MTRVVPDAAAFVQLASDGVAVPVVLELPHDLVTPLGAFTVLAEGERHAALLETAEAGSGDADISVVVPRAAGLACGSDVLHKVRAACADIVADVGIDLPPFVGGAVGMLAHEHVRTIEPRVPAPQRPHPSGAPQEVFLLVDELLVFEHRARRLLAIVTVRMPDAADPVGAAAAYQRACARLARIEARLRDADAEQLVPLVIDAELDAFAGVTCNMAAGEFRDAVTAAREHVLSGDVVQVVVSQRFERSCSADAVLAYRALRAVAPAPYHALLRLDDVHLIGASPEQLVGVRGRRIVTHPIAGTRRRGTTAAEDVALEQELLADPKERSEHMMLVDLGRNDVGRAAVPGTVRVAQLAAVERFSHVMHLVSRVEGQLQDGLHAVDALRACFPAGTLTGAPKVRAMEIIAELERDARGPYGGVVGYVGHGGSMDMAITIRTITLAAGRASVQAGAGVVAESDPQREYQETRDKARAALTALALAERAVVGADRPAPTATAAQAGGIG